jgi:hypothetical protein
MTDITHDQTTETPVTSDEPVVTDEATQTATESETVPDQNAAQGVEQSTEATALGWSDFVSDHFDAEILDMQLSIERFKICREAANAFIETLEAYRLSGAFKGEHLKTAFDSLIGRVDFIMFDLSNFGTIPVPPVPAAEVEVQ